MKKLIFVTAIILIVALPLSVWLGALIKNEILTARYFDEFESTVNTDDEVSYWVEGYDTAKVLSYSKDKAKVYFVKKDLMGTVISYVKENGSWKVSGIETPWSVNGSADESVFPYFRLNFHKY